ncbi:MAG TPA: hypothetical protein VM144_09880 [Aestuariivirga sp.]|nr:hypothetical protein [Aestuariivirga sp.]
MDAPDENSALQALDQMQGSDAGFAKQASGLDPTDLSIARAKDDPFGKYLRSLSMQPRQGETPDQREQRLYGKPMQGPSKTESFVRGAANTASWGFGDEMAAGMESVTGGDYNQALDRQRQSADVAQEENPWSYGGGQVAGAVVPGLLTAGATTAPTLGGRVVQGGLTAGGQGAVYGFGEGEDGVVPRLQEAGKTGAISTVLGGAAPVIASGVGAAWRGVSNWLASRGVDAKATAEILDMVQQSGMTPQQAEQRLNELGPEGMLADISSGMQVETAGTARADVGAGNLITDRLKFRRESAPSRVRNVLDTTIGQFKDPETLAEEIATARAPAGPAYELAKTHVVDTEDAANLLASKIQEFGANSPIGAQLSKIQGMLVDSNGRLVTGGARVHALRQQLDDMAKEAYRAGRGTESRQIGTIRAKLDQVLKGQIPGFKEADELWASTAKLDEAFQYGQSEMTGSKVYPKQNSKTLARMSDPEKEAAAHGLRADLEMKFSGNARNPTVGMERRLQSNMNDEKVPELIGKGAFDRIAKALRNEHTFLETSALGEAARGSRTNVLESAQRRWGTNGSPGANADAMAAALGGTAIGGPTTGLVTGASVYVNRARQAIAKALSVKSPDVIRATAEKLTTHGSTRKLIVQALTDAAMNTQGRIAAAGKVDKIIRLLMSSQAALAGQEANRAVLPSASGGSQ